MRAMAKANAWQFLKLSRTILAREWYYFTSSKAECDVPVPGLSVPGTSLDGIETNIGKFGIENISKLVSKTLVPKIHGIGLWRKIALKKSKNHSRKKLVSFLENFGLGLVQIFGCRHTLHYSEGLQAPQDRHSPLNIGHLCYFQSLPRAWTWRLLASLCRGLERSPKRGGCPLSTFPRGGPEWWTNHLNLKFEFCFVCLYSLTWFCATRPRLSCVLDEYSNFFQFVCARSLSPADKIPLAVTVHQTTPKTFVATPLQIVTARFARGTVIRAACGKFSWCNFTFGFIFHFCLIEVFFSSCFRIFGVFHLSFVSFSLNFFISLILRLRLFLGILFAFPLPFLLFLSLPTCFGVFLVINIFKNCLIISIFFAFFFLLVNHPCGFSWILCKNWKIYECSIAVIS